MKTKFFLIVAANEDANQTGLMIVGANDADEAFGKFLDNQNFDLDDPNDKDAINLLLKNFPVGIGELPELPYINAIDFSGSIQLEWYNSVD